MQQERQGKYEGDVGGIENRMRRPNSIISIPGGSSRIRELRECRRDNI